VLLPHLGNWELANLFLSKYYSLTTLYRKPKSDTYDEFIRNARSRRGAKLVQVGSSGVRALLKALKSGEVVSVLPDQVPRRSSGEFAPFFGEMTLTMTLATNLIHRTGAKAVCCYCKRLPGGKYELVFREVDDRIYDPDCGTALAGLNRSIERCIMDCREQYQWQYKRFLFLPNFEKRDYGDLRGSVHGGHRRRTI
jgi:KDO2-lipid IV(A) lauroyltransferase